MPLHHQFSYNSDSSLRPNEDNLLLILKLVYQNENLVSRDYHLLVLDQNFATEENMVMIDTV